MRGFPHCAEECLTCVLFRVVASLNELRRDELGASSSISSARPVATLALPHHCLALSPAWVAAAWAVAAICVATAMRLTAPSRGSQSQSACGCPPLDCK